MSAEILAKRAEIQARLATMQAQMRGPGGPPGPARPTPGSHNPLLHSAHLPPPPPPPTLLPPAPPAGATGSGGGGPKLDPELARKIAEARALVERMTQKRNQPVHNPYLVSNSHRTVNSMLLWMADLGLGFRRAGAPSPRLRRLWTRPWRVVVDSGWQLTHS